MKKRALGIGLTILSIAIWIAPLATAFGTNEWSMRKTLMPSEEEISDIQERIESVVGGSELSEGNFSVTDSRISGRKISLTVEFTSPFPFSIKMLNFDIELYDQDLGVTFAQMGMEEPSVKLDPHETKTITLEGNLTDDAQGYERIPDHVTFSNVTLKIKVSGITIEFSNQNN